MPAGSIASKRAFWFGFDAILVANEPGAGGAAAGDVVVPVVPVPVALVPVLVVVLVVVVVVGGAGLPAEGGRLSDPRPPACGPGAGFPPWSPVGAPAPVVGATPPVA
jgi:hypothetical protein